MLLRTEPDHVGSASELRARCLVTTIETGADGRVTGVVYRRERDDGPPAEERQRCRALVLAAGAVETPRLLLTNGLANASGRVGRDFMVHLGLHPAPGLVPRI